MFFSKFILLVLSMCTLLTVDAAVVEQLVLHFDINKTLIASDQAGGKTTDHVINHLLAEKYIGIWEEAQLAPLTYHDYVVQILAPGDSKDPALKKVRKKYLDRFIDYLNEVDHPLKEEVNQECLRISARIKSSKTFIFESFFTLLEFLESQNISYSVIIRSFGMDHQEIAAEIENVLQRPFFDQFVYFYKGNLFVDGEIIASGLEISQFFISGKNIVVQDDWSWWHSHGELREYGKPFYVNAENARVLQLFFDDNLENFSSPTNIVAPIDAITDTPLHIEKLQKHGQIIKVDTIQAILDRDYYIRKIREALQCGDLSLNLDFSKPGQGAWQEFSPRQERKKSVLCN